MTPAIHVTHLRLSDMPLRQIETLAECPELILQAAWEQGHQRHPRVTCYALATSQMWDGAGKAAHLGGGLRKGLWQADGAETHLCQRAALAQPGLHRHWLLQPQQTGLTAVCSGTLGL